MIECSVCGKKVEKAVADAEGWKVVEVDGIPKRVFGSCCAKQVPRFKHHYFHGTGCAIVSVRPIAKYQEAAA